LFGENSQSEGEGRDLTPGISFDWIRDNWCQVWKTSTLLSKLLVYKSFPIAIGWETPYLGRQTLSPLVTSILKAVAFPYPFYFAKRPFYFLYHTSLGWLPQPV
jgi:hypothetical protein